MIRVEWGFMVNEDRGRPKEIPPKCLFCRRISSRVSTYVGWCDPVDNLGDSSGKVISSSPQISHAGASHLIDIRGRRDTYGQPTNNPVPPSHKSAEGRPH